MAAKHTRLHPRQGGVAVPHITTDALLLPFELIESLQQVESRRGDWVFDRTQLESEHRRRETTRVNTLVLVERMAGLLFVLVRAVLGIGSATYLALNDKQ